MSKSGNQLSYLPFLSSVITVICSPVSFIPSDRAGWPTFSKSFFQLSLSLRKKERKGLFFCLFLMHKNIFQNSQFFSETELLFDSQFYPLETRDFPVFQKKVKATIAYSGKLKMIIYSTLTTQFGTNIDKLTKKYEYIYHATTLKVRCRYYWQFQKAPFNNTLCRYIFVKVKVSLNQKAYP